MVAHTRRLIMYAAARGLIARILGNYLFQFILMKSGVFVDLRFGRPRRVRGVGGFRGRCVRTLARALPALLVIFGARDGECGVKT
jgi:hypothetical protein